MNESHLAYLSLGSNIEPEVNLPKAVTLLVCSGVSALVRTVMRVYTTCA